MKSTLEIVTLSNILLLLSCLLILTEAKSTTITEQQSSHHENLRAQGRNSESTGSSSNKKSSPDPQKAIVDMHSVYQQHLVGPNVASAIVSHESGKNEKKDLWSRFGSKEAGVDGSGAKKGKLQTVGSVIGDIIGVLVSEIARFFGSVVSDVAREVTAHGFVSLFKQIADFTGINFGSHNNNHHNQATTASIATNMS